jgi:hypothetical protein
MDVKHGWTGNERILRSPVKISTGEWAGLREWGYLQAFQEFGQQNCGSGSSAGAAADSRNERCGVVVSELPGYFQLSLRDQFQKQRCITICRE